MSLLLDVFILSTAWVHVLLTPYTKVEESFNLHATHDVLMYGLGTSSLSRYDHFVFPGAVPRSFLGSIILAYSALPVIKLANSLGFILSKEDLQVIVRLVLATLNAVALCILRRAVSKRFGTSSGFYFALLSCTQFHLPFWMGRTLPNMFALFPVILAYAFLLSRRPGSTRPSPKSVTRAITLLTFTAVVFRVEIALLAAPLVLWALLARWVTFAQVVKTVMWTAGVSTLLTTLLDSYFWRQWPVWPELYSLYFNVYQNKSSEWGVSPFHAYFSSSLPKLVLASFPLSVLGFLVDRQVRGLMTWMVLFVLGMSLLGHKEWRFVVYVVPVVNVAAARGACWLTRQRSRTFFGRLGHLFVLACVAANILIAAVMTHVSMSNYPGGVALSRFNDVFDGTQSVNVHLSNLAAQTGASLFLQTHAPPYPAFLSVNFLRPSNPWIYNKTEDLTTDDITNSQHFTHAIVEAEQLDDFLRKGWTTVECIKGFDGFNVQRGSILGGKGSGEGIWDSLPRLGVRYSDKLCILSRK